MKHRMQHMRNLALKQLNLPNGSVRPGPDPGGGAAEASGAPSGARGSQVRLLFLEKGTCWGMDLLIFSLKIRLYSFKYFKKYFLKVDILFQ